MALLGTAGGRQTMMVVNTGTLTIPANRFCCPGPTNAAVNVFPGGEHIAPVTEANTTTDPVFVGVTVAPIAPGQVGVIIKSGIAVVETTSAALAKEAEVQVAVSTAGHADNGKILTVADQTLSVGRAVQAKYTSTETVDYGTSSKTYAPVDLELAVTSQVAVGVDT